MTCICLWICTFMSGLEASQQEERAFLVAAVTRDLFLSLSPLRLPPWSNNSRPVLISGQKGRRLENVCVSVSQTE